MIERFNFYDVYGYLIPGFVLLCVLALPVVLTSGLPADFKLPDLSSAMITLIVAYVAGHLLQIVATKTLTAGSRLPSDSILDADDMTFSAAFKTKLKYKIRVRFDIDVGNDKSKTAERGAAFFLCRNAVTAADTKTYCEQFEGMYVMMRGICAASAIAFAYDLGWICLFLSSEPSIPSRIQSVTTVAIICVIVLAVLSIRDIAPPFIRNHSFAGLLLVALWCAGYLAAGWIHPPTTTSHHVLPMVAAGALSALSALWTFGSFRTFTRTWARSVYENFLFQ
jgi:hypothetical protein